VTRIQKILFLLKVTYFIEICLKNKTKSIIRSYVFSLQLMAINHKERKRSMKLKPTDIIKLLQSEYLHIYIYIYIYIKLTSSFAEGLVWNMKVGFIFLGTPKLSASTGASLFTLRGLILRSKEVSTQDELSIAALIELVLLDNLLRINGPSELARR